jgi:23S rRNA-/tRNA-specific pseudouridylate synthase
MCVVNGQVDGSKALMNIHETLSIGNRVVMKDSRANIKDGKIAELTYTSLFVFNSKVGNMDSLSVGIAHAQSSGAAPPLTTDARSGAMVQSLLAVELHTGRKHQIRAQLAHIGHPIVGDAKYGAPQRFGKSRDIALHSLSIVFEHPISGARLRFAALPSNCSDWRKRFGSHVVELMNSAVNLCEE